MLEKHQNLESVLMQVCLLVCMIFLFFTLYYLYFSNFYTIFTVYKYDDLI